MLDPDRPFPVMDLIPELNRQLAGRYVVEREVGRGGMAMVFLAREERHGRQVALKVLHDHLGGALGAERFRREVLVAARLSHPSILPLLDSGVLDGDRNTPERLWYAMPFVVGESLRDRLTREGALPIGDARRFGRELAEALDYAHRNGVVHRDVKPENVLLAEGHAVLADFGIARALRLDGTRLTDTGIALGTPAYMSPEQITAQAELDGRADIYALGCVLYEMLAGEAPFTGPTVQAVIARAMTEDPRPLATARPPAAVFDGIIRQAMARVAADRYATAGDFAHALDELPLQSTGPTSRSSAPSRRSTSRLLALAGLGVALLVATIAVARRVLNERSISPTAVAGTRAIRVAVLPLRSLGGQETQYFADGITAALRNALATVQDVEVIAGTSADAFEDSLPSTVRATLGADFVLRGTVQWAGAMAPGTRVQVVPELLDVRGAAVIRPQASVDVALSDLFQAQGEIARRIVDSLGVQLGAEAATRLSDAPTRNLEAYQAFLRGDLARAVALDSTFGVAWARLATVESQKFFFDQDAGRIDRGRVALDWARRYAPDHWETYYAEGYYLRNVSRDYARALDRLRLAKARAPGNALVAHLHSALLWIVGRFPEALEEAQRGAALDPRNQQVMARLGRLELWLRDRPAASRDLGATLALRPMQMADAVGDTIWLALASGDTAAARAVVRSRPAPVAAEAAAWTMRVLWAGWALAPDQRLLALREMREQGVPPDQRVLSEVQDLWLRGRFADARPLADSASRLLRAVMRTSPREPAFWSRYLLTLAMGTHPESVSVYLDSARAVASVQVNHFEGAYWGIALAEAAALTGMRAQALALIRELLAAPGLLTPEWLRLDPYFVSLRGDPEFRQLAGLQEAG